MQKFRCRASVTGACTEPSWSPSAKSNAAAERLVLTIGGDGGGEYPGVGLAGDPLYWLTAAAAAARAEGVGADRC
eukprot:scaffold22976_cov114-Isochrysis_galbana.AAC.1